MHHFYWDASALVKRYAPENGTPIVNLIFAKVSLERMMCLSLCTSEVFSVFVRKKNLGIITDTAFSQAMASFRAEVIDSSGFRFVAVTDTLVFASHPIIQRYSLNATDALVLRSAIDIAAMQRQSGDNLTLLASDLRLLHAARAEGFSAFNPESDSPAQLDALI